MIERTPGSLKAYNPFGGKYKDSPPVKQYGHPDFTANPTIASGLASEAAAVAVAAKAEKLSLPSNFQIGDKVSVKVDNPKFGWGSQGINRNSIGVIRSIVKKDGVVLIDFPRTPSHPAVKGWACALSEVAIALPLVFKPQQEADVNQCDNEMTLESQLDNHAKNVMKEKAMPIGSADYAKRNHAVL